MTQRIVYAMDDPSYGGGAHVATLTQLDFVHRELGFEVAVLSLADAPETLRARYPYVDFIGPQGLYQDSPRPQNDDDILADLLAQVKGDDILCVPFENSRFREPAAGISCGWKVQWVHIDYAHWRNLNSWTQSITAQDGEIYRHFDRIVFISKMSKDGFVALHPHLRHKCRVCHNLMDTQRICQLSSEPLASPPFPERERMRLVTVARVEDQQKATGRSLMVADQLRRQGLDFEWVFVGGGAPEDMRLYRNYVRANHLSDHVFFAGAQQNPFAFVKNADLFCLFSHYEGIPNTIFEAMIIGTPVAATRVGATAEQIAHGTGWLFESNAQDICRGLAHLIKHPQLVKDAKANLAGYQYDNHGIKNNIVQIFSKNSGEEENDMDPHVSVIVPVYNVQDYLDQCLSSLANQTLDNIEILVVNDGSTDASGEVIDQYVQKYPGKFFRFDKENGGLGDARNYGITRARGEFLAFIDSDDFAETDMMEKLYNVIQTHPCDIVQADLHGFNNNVDYQAIERTPFEKEGLVPQRELMLNATMPVVVSACTKLYRKSLFEKHRFPNTWYEDMGLIPILFSHASVYYLPLPLYHYRWERAGSIQSQKTSSRTLEILQSQQRILEQCNPQWRKEAEFAVYEHTCRFYKGTPLFSTQTLEFVHQNAARFLSNNYIAEKIASGELMNLLPDEAALPKVIHYFKFSDTPLSSEAEANLESWRKHLPEYQIRAWSEKDFELAEPPYLQRAWMEKDYAAVAGYLACKALQREGGLYLDAGMGLNAPLNGLDGYEAFLPRAGRELVSWEMMGAAPGHPLLADIINLYGSSDYQPGDFEGIRHGIWQILVTNYGLEEEALGTCLLSGNIALYPAEKLLIDVGTGQPVAQHTCNGFSETDSADEVRHQLQRLYYMERYTPKAENDVPQPEVFSGSRYEIADAVVQRYGVLFTLRALCKRILAVVLPGLYRRLDKSGANKTE